LYSVIFATKLIELNFTLKVTLLLLLIVFAFVLNLNEGNSNVTLWDYSNNEITQNLILNYRLPKTIATILVGISLPLSGLMLQELFRNPLADPSVLGISSASGLGVAIVIFLSSILGFTGFLNSAWLLCVSAMMGAGLALLLIMYFSSKINSTSALIVIGFMIAGFSSALIGVMQFFAPSEKIKSYLIWSFGSISGLSWEQIGVFFSLTLIGILISIFSLKGIAGLRLGENYAHSMGINVKQTRWLILLSTAILTATATAFVGPIAFIGLAVPHICRMIFKEMNVIKLYVLVCLVGILLMLIFSWIAQLFPTGSLPINIITSLIGAPIVISIIWQQFKNRMYD